MAILEDLEYPLICFDVDGTLIDDTIFIWKTLHETFGTDPISRKQASDDYFAGRITYEQWFSHDLKLLKNAGADKERMLRIIRALRVMPGALETLNELKARGHILAIVSGSLDLVVKELLGEQRFDYLLINRIEFDKDGFISGGVPTPYDLEGKAQGLEYLASKLGLPLSRTVFVGDNENDIWIAKAAGLSIAFNCKSDELRKIAHVEIKKRDLKALLKIL